jgi:ribosomal-protein-alanine N-acetyltransferase
MEISNMTLEDFYQIEPVFITEFDDFWKPENLKSELKNLNSKYIVAKENGLVVGFAGIWFSVDDAHITNIVVRKSYRHKGIGNALLKVLIELGKAKESLTLEVNTQNEIAQKLYLKYGFENLGVRKKYYGGTQDAYIMTLYYNK